VLLARIRATSQLNPAGAACRLQGEVVKRFFHNSFWRTWSAVARRRSVAKDGQTLTLPPLELMRRYFQHVLPKGLNKIKHVGLYAAAHVRGELAVARQLLGDGDKAPAVVRPPPPTEPEPYETWQEFMTRVLGVDPRQCPTCRQGRLLLEATIERIRAPQEPKS